ncbi:MAG: hypothetical protein NZ903_03495 [Candidatus Micrarchaeota archaeon]|nr:hypothetical protein [Candidatus Micrarchaeota archaeon]
MENKKYERRVNSTKGKKEVSFEERLLKEKAMRKVSKDDVIFVSVSNICSMFWCQRQMIFKLKNGELQAYKSYLLNKESHGNLTIKEINNLLEKEKKRLKSKGLCQPMDIEMMGTLILTGEDKLDRGCFREMFSKENYPTLDCSFKWKRYEILASPDGITDQFCYEFKSVSNQRLIHYIKPIAISQANLYSYLFQRQAIRVQLYLEDLHKVLTFEEKTNPSTAAGVLITMDRLLKGELAPSPPKDWKCGICTFDCEMKK